MTTIRDVATLAEVSIATVSHVVNNSRPVSPDTRQRVERAIHELGFSPNLAGSALARRRGERRVMPRKSDAEEEFTSSNAERPRDSSDGRVEAAPGETTLALLRLVRAAQPVSRADLARR